MGSLLKGWFSKKKGLKPEQVPPEYGGTLADFDPAWYLKDKVSKGASHGAAELM